MKQFDKALRDLELALTLNPADAGNYNARGTIYERMGETAKAEADFERAKKLGFKSK
jgi:Flp pilus assembly protein TadD